MCRGYRELPLGLLLNRMGVRMPGIGGGEDMAMVKVVETTVAGNELAAVAVVE